MDGSERAAERTDSPATMEVLAPATAWAVGFLAATAIAPAPRGPLAVTFTAALFLAVKTLVWAATRSFTAGSNDEALVQRAAVAVVTVPPLAIALVVAPLAFADGSARMPGPAFAVLDGALCLALLLAPRIVRELRARRRERGGVVLVGPPQALARRLAEDAGARVEAALVDGPIDFGGPGARLHGVPEIDPEGLDRRLARGRVARVELLPPIAPPLRSWVEERCRAAGVRCDEGDGDRRSLRERIAPEELLERYPARLTGSWAERLAAGADDPVLERVDALLRGRRVLITGAGGALGEALAHAVAERGPSELVLVDRADGPLARVQRDLMRSCSFSVLARLVDLRDASAVDRVLCERAPELVLHAAGHGDRALAARH